MAGLSEQAERFGALIAHDDAVTVQLKGHLEEATTTATADTAALPVFVIGAGPPVPRVSVCC